MAAIDQQIIKLLGIRSSAHITHWDTQSYATHKALNKFYDGLTDLVDTFVETYFGKYGRQPIKGMAQLTVQDPKTLVDEAMKNVIELEKAVDKSDTDLLNILADIKGLCNHTQYMLTLK